MSSVNAQTRLDRVPIEEYEKLDARHTFCDTVLYRPRLDRTVRGRVRMARRSRSPAANRRVTRRPAGEAIFVTKGDIDD